MGVADGRNDKEPWADPAFTGRVDSPARWLPEAKRVGCALAIETNNHQYHVMGPGNSFSIKGNTTPHPLDPYYRVTAHVFFSFVDDSPLVVFSPEKFVQALSVVSRAHA
jgi:hypothetical protein